MSITPRQSLKIEVVDSVFKAEELITEYKNDKKMYSTKDSFNYLVDIDVENNEVMVHPAAYGKKASPSEISAAECQYKNIYKHTIARERLAKKLEMRRQLKK